MDKVTGVCSGKPGTTSTNMLCDSIMKLTEDIWCQFECYPLARDGSSTQVVITTAGSASGSVGCEKV